MAGHQLDLIVSNDSLYPDGRNSCLSQDINTEDAFN